MRTVKLRIPASTSNLGPGLDTLGLALSLYNYIDVLERSGTGVGIQVKGEGEKELPRNKGNLIYQSMKEVFKRVGYRHQRLEILCVNQIPMGRGLGSSGSARLGGIIAANILAGAGLGREEMIELAADLEGHPDNVVPSMVGGLVVANRHRRKVKFFKLIPGHPIKAVLVIPSLKLNTGDARAVLPKSIPLSDVVFNIGHTALLVGALVSGNTSMLRQAMDDRIHQPYRESLVPKMKEVFQAGMQSGAFGVFLSGSGPTIVALTDNQENRIARRMSEVWRKGSVKHQTMSVEVDLEGVHVLGEQKFL